MIDLKVKLRMEIQEIEDSLARFNYFWEGGEKELEGVTISMDEESRARAIKFNTPIQLTERLNKKQELLNKLL